MEDSDFYDRAILVNYLNKWWDILLQVKHISTIAQSDLFESIDQMTLFRRDLHEVKENLQNDYKYFVLLYAGKSEGDTIESITIRTAFYTVWKAVTRLLTVYDSPEFTNKPLHLLAILIFLTKKIFIAIAVLPILLNW